MKNQNKTLLLTIFLFLACMFHVNASQIDSVNYAIGNFEAYGWDIARVDSGDYYAGYLESISGYMQVVYSHSLDGATWDAPIGLTTIFSNKSDVQLLVKGTDKVYFFYENTSTVLYKIFDTTSGTFSTEYSTGVALSANALVSYSVTLLASDDIAFEYNSYDGSNYWYYNYCVLNTDLNTLSTCYLINKTSTAQGQSMQILEDNVGVLYALINTFSTFCNVWKSTDNGLTWASDYTATGLSANHSCSMSLGTDNLQLHLFAVNGSGVRYYQRVSGSWSATATQSTDAPKVTSITMNTPAKVYVNSSNVPFIVYALDDNSLAVAWFNTTDNKVYSQNLSIGNASLPAWSPILRYAETPPSEQGTSVFDFIVAETEGLVTSPFNLSMYSFDTRNLSLAGVGSVSQFVTPMTEQSSASCDYYRYDYQWLLPDEVCLFADNFEYTGDIETVNDWYHDLANNCTMTPTNTPYNYYPYVQNVAGKITQGSGTCEYYGINDSFQLLEITRNLSIPSEYSNGKYKVQFSVVMNASEGSRFVMTFDKSLGSNYAPILELIVGVNSTQTVDAMDYGDAFVWVSDTETHTWKRATDNTDCDVTYSLNQNSHIFVLNVDFTTGLYSLYKLGYRNCHGTIYYNETSLVTLVDSMPIYTSGVNKIDRLRWFVNPQYVSMPVDFTATTPPTNYTVGLANILVTRLFGAENLTTCDPNAQAFNQRCSCGSLIAELGQYCCYTYENNSFTLAESLGACYPSLATCTYNVRLNTTCTCGANLAYPNSFCCNTFDGQYQISETQCTTANTGFSSDSVGILGDLGMTQGNVSILAGIIATIVICVALVYVGVPIVLNALILVFATIAFFVMGFYPAWVIFLLAVFAIAGIAVMIKSALSSGA
jgi:hypothetical protein